MPIVITGRAIKIARAMVDMSQRQLALPAGMRPHRIWEIENGVGTPRPDELAAILGVLTSEGVKTRPCEPSEGRATRQRHRGDER